MTFKPCKKREKVILYKADGSRDAVRRCTEQECHLFQKDVTPELCADCGMRQFVNQRADAEKAKPVPLNQRFQIKRVEPHTVTAKTTWIPCKLRQTLIVMSCCGSEDRVVVCNNAASKYVGQEVVPELCRMCTVRIE